MAPSATRRHAAFFRDHLLGNVIPFWARYSIDRDHGGFLTHLDRDGRVFSAACKHSAMQARTVYAFSLAHQLDPRPEHLAIADHGAHFLREHLWDRAYGGWYRSVGRDGEVLEADKPIISQAYALIGLIAHHRASGDAESLDRAEDTLRLLDEHAWDLAHGGYYERCRRDWTVESQLKTASVHNDMTAAVLLASAILGRRYEERLVDLADILVRGLSIGWPPKVGGICQRDWTYSPSATGDVIDVGQGLKAAATLAEASRHTGRPEYLAHAGRLVEFYLRTAWDLCHGGFLTRLFRGGRLASDEKLWWTQCEGIVALAALGSLTGDEDYRAYLDRLTDFCVAHFIDEAGEWYTSCALDGRVRNARKGDTWKGPYHSARAGFFGWLYLSGREVGPPRLRPGPAAQSPAT